MAAEKKKEKAVQPPWQAPRATADNGAFDAGVSVYNSLTSSETPLVPMRGKQLRWYSCGPTVYDSAHLGHARNYVTFDILRRVLEDYFGYHVHYVMNVTDIDDKIILRARRNHLFRQYAAAHASATSLPAAVRDDVRAAWTAQFAAWDKKHAELSADAAKGDNDARLEAKLIDDKRVAGRRVHDEQLAPVLAAGDGDDAALSALGGVAELLRLSSEPLAVLLDNRAGSTVTDHSIFRAHAAAFEDEFFEDMRALGVKTPDVVTRVSEYVDEIVEYVKGIVANSFAYVADDGSVYFDTQEFAAADGHAYGKLEPASVGNAKLLAEGEGALSAAKGGKRSPSDFALWKASKPGEPAWPSPWGAGRPGWHIECSAMASAYFREQMDVHSGGQDLKFPHHDNELAQAEARYRHPQWVNYFLHTGHLHIEGLKMSKSLKNFVTIREALRDYTPRQIRMLFVSKKWNKIMNYARAAMDEVRGREKTLAEFFSSLKFHLSEQAQRVSAFEQKWNDADRTLNDALLGARAAVDAALRKNLDTTTAFAALLELVSAANTYLRPSKRDDGTPTTKKAMLLQQVGAYVTRILRVFGIIFDHDVGFPAVDLAAQLGGGIVGVGGDGNGNGGAAGEMSAASRDEHVAPFAAALAKFRQQVRAAAMAKASPAELMTLCDELRDADCARLGLRLEDAGDVPYKLVDAAALQRELAEKRANAAKVQLQKAQNKIKPLEAELDKLREGAQSTRDFWASHKTGYSAFDDATGMPTADKDGKALDDAARKKLDKDKQFAAYKKKVDAFRKAADADANVLETKRAAIDALRADVARLEAQMADAQKQQ